MLSIYQEYVRNHHYSLQVKHFFKLIQITILIALLYFNTITNWIEYYKDNLTWWKFQYVGESDLKVYDQKFVIDVEMGWAMFFNYLHLSWLQSQSFVNF